MTIPQMHVWFRQYAQQMGMQNVRAIYPEQIDILINTSISDIVNELVRNNVGIRNDRVVTDNAKIGQINALRSLYTVKSVNSNKFERDIRYTDLGLYNIEKFIIDNANATDYAINNVLYIVDIAISYSKDKESYTRLFPVRIIEEAYLADTLNDFVLKPRVRTPIAVIYKNSSNNTNASKLELYLGENYETGNGLITSKSITLQPYELRVSYIAAPAKVKYVSDLGDDNVDCDLPESMHVDILKHAVDLYNISVNGGLYNAQQNEQNQQREAVRNEARPTNEGYQN